MSQYMLLVHEEEVSPAEQPEPERVAGHRVLECADLEQAERLPMARRRTIEARPVVAPGERLALARQAGAEASDATGDYQA